MNSSDEAADALVETLVTELGQRGPTYRRALHRLAAAVRAEAVADERRRIADAIEREVSDWSDIPLTGTTTIPDRVLVIDGLTIAFRLVAAGSVPVAAPEPVDEWECPECGATTRARMADKVATPPAEPADDEDETPTGKIGQSEAEALRTKAAPIDLLASLQANLPPAPSQPVTCEHGKPRAHEVLEDGLLAWCPGPVSVPKESSE